MKRLLLISFAFIASFTINAQKTIQERLGYPKDTRLVIVHADDLGVSHSENMASIQSLEKGSVVSASIMVPCPWFGEIAEYAVAHPKTDFGLHLTLTSEWKFYKWGSVLPRDQVSSLADEKGFLYSNLDPLYKNGTPGDAAKELHAQVERAKQFGIRPTHFDSHMGSAFYNPAYLDAYIKLGREYKTPVLMVAEAYQSWLKANPDNKPVETDVLVDKVMMANPPDFKAGMDQFYMNTLKSIQPGLTYLILHAAFDNDEMRAVTAEHPDYGAAWRQADFNFFNSEACKKAIAANHIQVITWREIQEKIFGGTTSK